MDTRGLFHLLERIHPLPDKMRQAIEDELETVFYPPGQVLVSASDFARSVYYLVGGFCVSYYYNGDRKTVTTFWKPGEIVMSPRSFFEGTPAEEIIQVTSKCELLSLSLAAVNQLFENFPVANFIVRVIVSQYHARGAQHIIDLHNLDARQRYDKLVKDYPGIELHVSQDMIASYLNITPQSLSRLRSRRI